MREQTFKPERWRVYIAKSCSLLYELIPILQMWQQEVALNISF